jgi:outer membrane protein OmpA-like peptidoglycan-associated protein
MRTRYNKAGWLLACLAVGLVSPGVARAQDVSSGSLPVQQFEPLPGGTANLNHVSSGHVLRHLKPSFGLYLNYAWRPLVLNARSSSTDEVVRRVELVSHQVQADALVSLALWDQLELGLAMPVTLFQSAGDPVGNLQPRELASLAPGDLRIIPKWSIFNHALDDAQGKGASLALMAVVKAPTGDTDSFQGNGDWTVEPRLAFAYQHTDGIMVAAHVGYVVRRQQAPLLNLEVGNELTYGLGYQHPISPGKFLFIAELFGKAPADPDVKYDARILPLELLVSGRALLSREHALSFGAGPGITGGYGTPTVRAMLGYTYSGMPPEDSDGDGYKDPDDKCPMEPEDFDQFQDEDGCPDPDNDADGILDVEDECPMEPGVVEYKGCPVPDIDGDRIPDDKDNCPNIPNTQQADLDGDGIGDACDDDLDGDGIKNDVDSCKINPNPDQADLDGDGIGDVCDDDIDGDGILNVTDQCPREKEVYNGVKDEDGCPDEGVMRVKVTKDKIEIMDKIFFEFDKDVIKSESFPILDQVAGVLKSNPQIMLIEVQGHTDDQGDDSYNQDLSQRRAEAVKRYLNEHGVAEARMSARGYGESQPLVPVSKKLKGKKLKAARENNRRVEFLIRNQRTEVEVDMPLDADGKPMR